MFRFCVCFLDIIWCELKLDDFYKLLSSSVNFGLWFEVKYKLIFVVHPEYHMILGKSNLIKCVCKLIPMGVCGCIHMSGPMGWSCDAMSRRNRSASTYTFLNWASFWFYGKCILLSFSLLWHAFWFWKKWHYSWLISHFWWRAGDL